MSTREDKRKAEHSGLPLGKSRQRRCPRCGIVVRVVGVCDGCRTRGQPSHGITKAALRGEQIGEQIDEHEFTSADRGALYEEALARFSALGLPSFYLEALTAYLKDPETTRNLFKVPRPFEFLPRHQALYQMATRGLSIAQIVERTLVIPDDAKVQIPGLPAAEVTASKLQDLPENPRLTLCRSLEEFTPKAKRMLRVFGDRRARMFREARDVSVRAYTARRRKAGADEAAIEGELPLLKRALIEVLSVGITVIHYPKGCIKSLPEPPACTCGHGPMTAQQEAVIEERRQKGASAEEIRELEKSWKRMVLKGRGLTGWIYVCPECGRERMKRASKKALGLAGRGRVPDEQEARYLIAVRCLCPEGKDPWGAIAALLKAAECLPGTTLRRPLADVAEYLRREHQRANSKDIFGAAAIRQIQREARRWPTHSDQLAHWGPQRWPTEGALRKFSSQKISYIRHARWLAVTFAATQKILLG